MSCFIKDLELTKFRFDNILKLYEYGDHFALIFALCLVLTSAQFSVVILHRERPAQFFYAARGLSKPVPMALVRLGPERMMGMQSNFIDVPI